MSSTGAAAAIPKTVEVKSVSHGMITYPCSLKGISILIICTDFDKQHEGQPPC